MRRFFLIAAAVLLLAGCGAQVDLEAERAALRATDQAWSQSASDLDLFMSYFAEDAVAAIPDAEPAQGKKAIRNLWSGIFRTPGFSLKWTSTRVDVAESGAFGYVAGTFELTLQDSGGTTHTRTGKYQTVWRKQPDGQWKAVADLAALDSPP
ncbi:MAG: YybH family protein, partial [Candidatus Acidiferrales bacterium]